MTRRESAIRVKVDVTNPGQFFACCGLLELADRLWPGAEGWFEEGEFCISCGGALATLIRSLEQADLAPIDPDDKTSTAIRFGAPFNPPLLVNWWKPDEAGTNDGRDLKVWAGTMESFTIARAMQKALCAKALQQPDLFDVGMVVTDPESPGKKKEPFYFDVRRAPNAHSRDVGFAPNDLGMTTVAHPAVELLCLVGLQRYIPRRSPQARQFDYFTWTIPTGPVLLPGIAAHAIADASSRGYRFESWYRTGQKKHKAFRSAIPLTERCDQ